MESVWYSRRDKANCKIVVSSHLRWLQSCGPSTILTEEINHPQGYFGQKENQIIAQL